MPTTQQARPDFKKQTGKKNRQAKAAERAATPKEEPKAVAPGSVTKRPADLAKSQHQPPKGQKVTDAMIRRAREEWGIEPYAKITEIAVLKPAARGHIVHAALTAKAEQTLCGTPTNWVGGASVVEDKSELNCIWCMTRITALGK